ncbi:MAG: hypothetical protein ABSH03_12390 [Candidatus Lustribacter sp.]|jgi:hypothetical protein
MLLLVAVVANAFLSAFAGSWTCTPHLPGVVAPPESHWSIAAAPQGSWAVVRWSSRGESGTAFVGYLAPEQQWIYEDFHSDGSFATNTSSGPQNGTWTWNGTFTSPQRAQHGAIQWRRDKQGFRQGFGRMLGTSFRETSSATCRPDGR